MAASQNTPAGPSNSKPTSSFEFTKRKKYADLLISELTDSIQLILSVQCKVLFCSPAVTELLGWRDEDLIDGAFIDLINSESSPLQALLLSSTRLYRRRPREFQRCV